ncbi:MAG: DUF1841 family protein [Nitrospiria bacterium]
MDTLFTIQTLRNYAMIWQKMNEGADLIGDEALVADAIRLHPEFDSFWPNGDAAIQPQEIDGYVVNPLIHTGLHFIVEKQIQEKSPIETVTALDTLLENGTTRHDALHQMIGLWGELYFKSLRESSPLYEWEYVELLNRLAAEAKPI